MTGSFMKRLESKWVYYKCLYVQTEKRQEIGDAMFMYISAYTCGYIYIYNYIYIYLYQCKTMKHAYIYISFKENLYFQCMRMNVKILRMKFH